MPANQESMDLPYLIGLLVRNKLRSGIIVFPAVALLIYISVFVGNSKDPPPPAVETGTFANAATTAKSAGDHTTSSEDEKIENKSEKRVEERTTIADKAETSYHQKTTSKRTPPPPPITPLTTEAQSTIEKPRVAEKTKTDGNSKKMQGDNQKNTERSMNDKQITTVKWENSTVKEPGFLPAPQRRKEKDEEGNKKEREKTTVAEWKKTEEKQVTTSPESEKVIENPHRAAAEFAKTTTANKENFEHKTIKSTETLVNKIKEKQTNDVDNQMKIDENKKEITVIPESMKEKEKVFDEKREKFAKTTVKMENEERKVAENKRNDKKAVTKSFDTPDDQINEKGTTDHATFAPKTTKSKDGKTTEAI